MGPNSQFNFCSATSSDAAWLWADVRLSVPGFLDFFGKSSHILAVQPKPVSEMRVSAVQFHSWTHALSDRCYARSNVRRRRNRTFREPQQADPRVRSHLHLNPIAESPASRPLRRNDGFFESAFNSPCFESRQKISELAGNPVPVTIVFGGNHRGRVVL